MESEKQKVLAQVGGSRTQDPGWFAEVTLPSELFEGAVRRLSILGVLTAGTFAAFVFTHVLRNLYQPVEPPLTAAIVSTTAIVLSITIFLIPRLSKITPQTFLRLGAVYQVAMAFLIGITDHHTPWQLLDPIRGWSSVGVWIMIFAIIVPSTPARTLVVSSIAALMDPIAMTSMVGLGNPWPAAELLPQIFGPTVAGLVTAVVASRINYCIGRKLHDATELGSYQLQELLGRGGMGEVWRAEHKMLARPAAIKLIRPDALSGDRGESAENLLRRFEREAQATALLESEHTIEVYDFGAATDGSFFYVMELLDGLDLDQLIKRHGPVTPSRAIFLLQQICESLAEAHASGLIHRDIKPSNIFVCRRAQRHDVVKLLDFGLVKSTPAWAGDVIGLTAEGSISGTPAFMVPEIIMGKKEIDGRADLYAVGCVGYWLLSGRLVFESDNSMEMVMGHAGQEPVRLSERSEQPIPEALENLIHACLEKKPDQRPASAELLGERLAAIENGTRWAQPQARAWWQAHGSDPPPDEDPASNATTVPPEVLAP